MSSSNRPSDAATSSQARKPVSLFSFGFKPAALSTSSPSGRSSATGGASRPLSNSTGARSQSVQSDGSTSAKPNTNKGSKGSRPGRVALPGAGLAALKRLATAPAALPTQNSLPPSISRQSSSSHLEPSSTPSEPVFEPLVEMQDSQKTPKRAEDRSESSPTPRGLGIVSSPSQRLDARLTPLASREIVPSSSSTLTGEVVEDSDPDSTQPRNVKNDSLNLQNLDSAPSARRAESPTYSSDEGSIMVSSRSASSSASVCSTPRRKTKSKDTAKAKATPPSVRKTSTTSRKATASPSGSAFRPLRSVSRAPSSARASPALSTRSSARLRSQSVEASANLPRLALVNATSSIANLSTTEESSDSLRLKPTIVSNRSRSPTPSLVSQQTSTAPRSRPTNRSNSHHPSSSSDELAIRLVTPKRAAGGPSRFERDPSGSPLSDLAPTPKKEQKRARSVKSGTWRKHSFELVVEVPPAVARSFRAGSLRRERDTATSDYTDRPSSEANDRRIKAESDEEEESRRSGDEATDEDEQSSKSNRQRPSRRSSSIARGKRRADSSSPPRARRGSKKNKHESDSSSSSSEEEEEELDVLAALARARTRVAAGQTLAVTSPVLVSEASTAPTTASSAHAAQDKDEGLARRSTRAKHQTDHYSPTSVIAGSSRGATTQADVKGKGKMKSDGDKDFQRIMKELQAAKVNGKGKDYYDNLNKMLDQSDDDLDGTKDGSDDEDLPDLNINDSKRLDTLAQGIAGAVSEDDLLSPDKLAHKRRAKEVANILGDELKKKAKAGKTVETAEERQARTVWKESHRYEIFDLELLKGEGWLGQVASAIKDGLRDPQRFPSIIVLCSQTGEHGVGSSEDHKFAASWLISLICHPATTMPLAEKLLNLFRRVVQLASRSTYLATTTPFLDQEQIVQQLVLLGGEPKKLVENAETIEEPKSDDDDDDDDSLMELELLGPRARTPLSRPTKPLTVEARVSAVERWCRLVQIAASSPTLRSSPLDESAYAQLVVVCVKLSLDPTSAVLRGPLERTLVSLLHASASQTVKSQFAIFRNIATLHRSSRPHTQVEVLRSLPHQSSSDKKIRKWIAWAFMAEDQALAKVLADETSLSRSLLPLLLELVSSPPASSAFNPPATSTDSSNDIKLFQQATLLLISFTNLDEELNDAKDKLDAQKLVDQIKIAVKKIDGKLRADARKGLLVERIQAKNLLTSITNSLDYQLRRARGQQGVSAIMDVDEADEHKSKKVKVETKTSEEQAVPENA